MKKVKVNLCFEGYWEDLKEWCKRQGKSYSDIKKCDYIVLADALVYLTPAGGVMELGAEVQSKYKYDYTSRNTIEIWEA